MKQIGLLALLLSTGAVACRKPALADPAVEAYHAAVVRFAETSKLTQDLTYRDPRFDPILDALDRIPLASESKAQAEALADRIRSARALANSLEPTSERMQAEAAAAPPFEPVMAVPASAAAKSAQIPVPPAPAAPGSVDDALTAGPAPQGHGRHLPAWYAGYFGAAATVPSDAGSAIVDDDASAPATPPMPHPKPSRPADADAAAPPPVYGLPGPAGGALQGRPGAGE